MPFFSLSVGLRAIHDMSNTLCIQRNLCHVEVAVGVGEFAVIDNKYK